MMAFNIRSIIGRNSSNPGAHNPWDASPISKLSIGDVETAKAHGITSRRTMKKNIGDLRTVQYAQSHQQLAQHDPFGSAEGEQNAEAGAAGSRLMAAGVKSQNSFGAKVRSAWQTQRNPWQESMDLAKERDYAKVDYTNPLK